MLGPYYEGLGKRKSKKSDTEEENPLFFSSPHAGTIQSRRVTYTDAELLPKFDPGEKTSTVCGWLHKIDQLGDIYGWTEKDKMYVMQLRLRGAAREWYDQLEDYDLSWDCWKDSLSMAFPRASDFADRLEDMTTRLKRSDETMTLYYHEKIALLRRCNIVGESAISCIIRGLPMELRANAKAYQCNTPEKLYYGFLCALDNYKAPEVNNARTTLSTWRRGDANNSSTKKTNFRTCYNCRRMGHAAKDCRIERCRNCNRLGHDAAACWHTAGISKQDPQNRQAIQVQHNVYYTSLEIVDDLFKKKVTINNCSLIGYIDTGSKVNIISATAVQVMQLTVIESTVMMRGFGGKNTVSLGKVNFKIQIDDLSLSSCAEITNTDLKEIDIIIGLPIINQPGVSLVTTSKIVKLVQVNSCENNDPFVNMSTPDVNPNGTSLFLSQDVTVPPNSHIDVEIYVQTGIEITSQNMLVTRPVLFCLGKVCYYIPETIMKCPRLAVINLSDVPILWKADKLLARADIHTYNEVLMIQNGPNAVGASCYANDKLRSLANLDIGNLHEREANQLLNLLNRYSNTFSTHSNELGCCDLVEMEIKTSTEKPVYCKPYRLSFKENEIVQHKVNELVSADIVRESQSEYASPVVLVKKKGGDYRLCIDYRALNAQTEKDRYPLPHIDDQVNKLAGKVYFTSLDLAQGYYQVKMAPDSIRKTAFVTPTGHFEFLKMPFGLANGPAVFSRLIRMVLGKLEAQIAIYLDDINIPSTTIEEGLKLLDRVLLLLSKANLKLNLKKCFFLKTSANYLGHEITAGTIRPGQAKINCVKSYRRPRNVHEVRQFIGLTSYFRKFIRAFAEIARPLTNLTKKKVPWFWGPEQEQAFEHLKSKLTERPILGIYEPKAKTELHTDASKLGLGGILMQYQNDGSLRPIAYFSRVTSQEEQFYHSYELETLAVVESLKRFRIYLVGVPVKVITDCAALRTTLTKKDLVPRIARWWLTIQDFDLEIEYRPGNRMQHVDALSRNPIETDQSVLMIDNNDWCVTLQLQDDGVQNIMRQLREGTSNPDIHNNYELSNDCLFRKTLQGNRFVIPKIAKWSLLQRYHDKIGHLGFEKCEKAIKSQFWFPAMTRFIRKYVNGCLQCAFKKGNYGRLEGELHPIEKVAIPMHTIHLDHLGPFLKTRNGNSYVLVMIDSFTKFVFARAVKRTNSVETIKHVRDIISQFGNPRRIITDRGVAFTSRYFKEFANDKQFKHVLNAVACPRANGQVERVNRTIVNGLNTTAESECTWDDKLIEVISGINNTPHSVTGFTPFQLMFAHENSFLPACPSVSTANTTEERLNQVRGRRDLAKIRIDRQMTKMKERFDNKHKKTTKFEIGDFVLWKGGQAREQGTRVTKKLGSLFTGPYRISEANRSIDRYKITSIKGMKGYKKFCTFVRGDSLRPYNPTLADSSTDTDHEVERDDLIDLLES